MSTTRGVSDQGAPTLCCCCAASGPLAWLFGMALLVAVGLGAVRAAGPAPDGWVDDLSLIHI